MHLFKKTDLERMTRLVLSRACCANTDPYHPIDINLRTIRYTQDNTRYARFAFGTTLDCDIDVTREVDRFSQLY